MNERLFILEDEKERIDWFKKRFCIFDLTICNSFDEAASVYDNNYSALFLDHDMFCNDNPQNDDYDNGLQFCKWICTKYKSNELPMIVIHSVNNKKSDEMFDYLDQHGFIVMQLPFYELQKEWNEQKMTMCGYNSFNVFQISNQSDVSGSL